MPAEPRVFSGFLVIHCVDEESLHNLWRKKPPEIDFGADRTEEEGFPSVHQSVVTGVTPEDLDRFIRNVRSGNFPGVIFEDFHPFAHPFDRPFTFGPNGH